MKIYTSYFGNIKNLPKDFTPVSIAGKTPAWFKGEVLKPLAPQYIWWKEWKDRFGDDPESDESRKFYTERYRESVLAGIDGKWVETTLGSLLGTPCLLCYERPDKFCHRHIVADWLVEHGFECEEYQKPVV